MNSYPAIVGVGGEFPAQSLSNAALAAKTGLTSAPAALEAMTGVNMRYWATEGELPSDLATGAARKALTVSGTNPEDLIGIVLATITPDQRSPSTASIVHDNIGARTTCLPFDVGMDCSGGIIGLQLACNQLELAPEGPKNVALAIGVNILSQFVDYNDPATAALVGDGAGAFILQSLPGASRPQFASLTLPNRDAVGVVHDSRGTGLGYKLVDPRHLMALQGTHVTHPLIDIMTESAQQVAQQAGLYDSQGNINWRQVDYLVPLQTNLQLIKAVASRLRVPDEKLIVTVGEHGSTSSASLALALEESWQQGRIVPEWPHRMLFTAAGDGFVGGAALIDVVLPAPG